MSSKTLTAEVIFLPRQAWQRVSVFLLLKPWRQGIPAVGLSNCHGISDLIQNGKNGFLTDTSAESVAEALAKLMSNDALRKSMGAYAKESMKQYSPVRIYDQWESLLMSLVKGTDKQIL